MKITLKNITKNFNGRQIITPTDLTIEIFKLYDASGPVGLRKNDPFKNDSRS